MPRQNETIFAKLILDGALSPEALANYFELTGQFRTDFLEETRQALLKSLLNPETTPQQMAQLANEISRIQYTPLEKRAELTALDKLTHIIGTQDASDFSDSVEEIPLFKDGVRLAATLASAVGNPNNLKNNTTASKLASGTLVSTHDILQRTAFSGLSAVEGVPIAGEVGAFVGLLREYQFQNEKTELSEILTETIHQAENDYLKLHLLYAEASQYYQHQLAQTPKDAETYRPQFESWLTAERFFQEKIQHHQEKIAAASTLTQELISKRRTGRANDILNTALTAMAFAGPPGAIASTVIKGITSLGSSIADSHIADSAKFNHGIGPTDRLLWVANTDSVRAAQERMQDVITPLLAMTSPELKPTLFNRVQFEENRIQALVDSAKNRTSCSFALSHALPELPVIDPLAPGKTFADPDVKKKGKAQLEQLVKAQQALSTELRYLNLLANTLLKTYPDHHPYVVNLDQLKSSLIKSHLAIQERRSIIEQQMGETYLGRDQSKGKTLLTQLKDAEQNFVKGTWALEYIQDELQKTPHAALFLNGTPRDVVHLSTHDFVDVKKNVIETYSQATPLARLDWLRDIEFNLSALEILASTCETLNHGRHITNLHEAITQLNQQLLMYRKLLASSQTPHISSEEKALLDKNAAKVEALFTQSGKLDMARISYLCSHGGELTTPQARYEELSQLHQQLSDYIERNTGSASRIHIRQVLGKLEEVQRALQTTIPALLIQPTPINLQNLNQTDHIVSPSRVFFGLNKHTDMKRAIEEKIGEIKKINPITDTVQIMPLRAIDESIINACRGDQSLLARVIEGIKTEIQWTDQFQDACRTHRIHIANMNQTITYYDLQIKTLQRICQHKSEVMGTALEAIHTSRSDIVNAATTIKSKLKALSTAASNALDDLTKGTDKQLGKAVTLSHELRGTLHIPELNTSVKPDATRRLFDELRHVVKRTTGEETTPSIPRGPVK